MDGLDFVILGATEIDVDFNVNVITNSNNQVISGAGGHGDTAEGAKMMEHGVALATLDMLPLPDVA